jgi:protein-tyrosine-phosphatase
MVEVVQQPQSLVSYHLARLRDGGLVTSRRSSKDGRATYYHLDLDRCGASLSMTGASLHPGLDVRLPSQAATNGRRARGIVRVLFVCSGNSARSQIAEALMRSLGGGAVDAVSAGSDPKPVHPFAVKALAGRGIDISDWHSKPLTVFAGRRFDYVVTLCDKVRERCPEFPGGETIHWSIEDPSQGPEPAHFPRFQHLTTELETRVRWLSWITFPGGTHRDN